MAAAHTWCVVYLGSATMTAMAGRHRRVRPPLLLSCWPGCFGQLPAAAAPLAGTSAAATG